MMPVLFNRWNDRNLPMGMVTERDLTTGGYDFAKFQHYVHALMERFGHDDRVMMA